MARLLDRMDDAVFRRTGNGAVLLTGAGHLGRAVVLALQTAA